MDRRTFLRRSTLGSAAALTGLTGVSAGLGAALSGCGAAHARPVLGATESALLLGRLERGLAAIRDVPAGAMAMAIPWEVRPDHHETILRLGLESLVVADVNRCVPNGTDVPQELAERIAAEVPTLERAVGTYHTLLARMPPAARREIDRRIRERPETTMDVAAWVDENAATLGVAGDSRLLLRSAASNMGTRMRRQSASAVIDDSLGKVERALSRSRGALWYSRTPTTVAMIDAIWQAVDGAGGGSPSPGPSSAVPPAVVAPESASVPGAYAYTGPSAEPETGPWSERWARPGDENIEIGAILMPFGLLTCTVLLWVGLGMIIGGISRNNSWDGRPNPGH